MDAIVTLRAAYLSAAGLVLLVYAIPSLRSRFLDYGPRSSGLRDKKETGNKKEVSGNAFAASLDTIATWRVPHSWFISFYAVSVTLSLFWGAELLVKGLSFLAISEHAPAKAMSFSQVLVVWIMMFTQGSRRLYECMAISKPSDSRMWFGHWALGILFYALTSVTVWIEGAAAIRDHTPSTQDFLIQGPSARTFIGVMIFLLASGFQHECHAYLASLKGRKEKDDDSTKSHYKLPEHPAFSISLTPHYSAECLIYLALAIAATPKGDLLNWTFVAALVFVMTNLGVTAQGTARCYTSSRRQQHRRRSKNNHSTSFKHTVFLTSASGHIGQQFVSQLLDDNVKLILPTSNTSRLQSNLPASANSKNVTVEEGSIGNHQWLETLFKKHNVDIAYLCLTAEDEFMASLNFLDAMKRAGTIKHFVYISACGNFTSEEGYKNVNKLCSAMHVLVKPASERKIQISEFPWTTTVLGPTLFYDNDLRSKYFIMNGYFDEPLGEQGVSRVSTKDIATVARNASLQPEKWAGKKIMIGSKRKYTGTETAKLWSEAIGKEVKICPSTKEGLDEFEKAFFEKMFDACWARDLRLMYELFAVVPFGPTEEEYEMLVECLGRELEDYEEFVRRTGREWTS